VPAVLGVSLLAGVLLLICERPDHLPANPPGPGKGIEVMQAKASRGADVAELTEAEINGYLRQRAGRVPQLSVSVPDWPDDKTDGCRILLGDSVDASGAALHISALFCDFYWSSGQAFSGR